MKKICQVYDIESPSQIKDLSIEKLTQLCSDIRAFLIDSISKTGGHLSSNLRNCRSYSGYALCLRFT